MSQSTERLYYHDSFLFGFDAHVLESLERDGKNLVVLDRTAFYPTSGGQLHDIGNLSSLENGSADDRGASDSKAAGSKLVAILDVFDEEDGKIYHVTSEALAPGKSIRGVIDEARRRDHIQQHSGQHVLSAAFVRLFDVPTASFHMGAESCTIDLSAKSLSETQIVEAEKLANQVITEDRPVSIRVVPLEEARTLGLRKLPPKQTGELRLIDIRDFDLTACGGTHVRSTGQIGSILLRKVENVKQGVRLEFVCGARAVSTARADYKTLTETAALFSSHIRDVPQQVQRSVQESKAAAKAQLKLLEELAGFQAEHLLVSLPEKLQVIVLTLPERDSSFVKLLAQKLTAARPNVIALLASGSGQPTLVFAQSPGQKGNMGQLMKDAMSKLGGRGGGNADMAQGGFQGADLGSAEKLLQEIKEKILSGAS